MEPSKDKTKITVPIQFGWNLQVVDFCVLNGWSFSVLRISFGAIFTSSLLTIGQCEGIVYFDLLWIRGVVELVKAKKSHSPLLNLK